MNLKIPLSQQCLYIALDQFEVLIQYVFLIMVIIHLYSVEWISSNFCIGSENQRNVNNNFGDYPGRLSCFISSGYCCCFCLQST